MSDEVDGAQADERSVAADAFAEAVGRAYDGAPVDLESTAARTLVDVDLQQRQEFVEHARHEIRNAHVWLHRPHSPAKTNARTMLIGRIRTKALHAMTPFPGREELSRARADLTAIDGELEKLIADMDRAVRDGNADAVPRLRSQIEIGIPKRAADLQEEIAELELEQAQAALAVPQQRMAAAQRASEEAQAALAAAQAELNVAAATAQDAQQVLADRRADLANGEHAALAARQELDRVREDNDAAVEARTRRLLGLPEPRNSETPIAYLRSTHPIPPTVAYIRSTERQLPDSATVFGSTDEDGAA